MNSTELDELCKRIQEVLSDFPCHSRGILGDLEICIGGSDTISSENVSEISLTREMISVIARHLGHEESIRILVSSEPTTSTESSLSGTLGEQLSEQLLRDGIAKLFFPLTIEFSADYALLMMNRLSLSLS